MLNRTPIILTSSLDTNRGGVTKAVLTRANALAELHEEVVIITMLYQQYFTKKINQLKKRKELSRNVKVLNFFHEMRSNEKKKKQNFKQAKYQIQEKGLTAFPDDRLADGRAFRYYTNGLYIKYKRFNKKGELEFIDYMSRGRQRECREEYDNDGLLIRSREMDLSYNKPSLDRYFDARGNCFMSVWVNPENSKEQRTLTFGDTAAEYDNLYDLQTVWLNQLLAAYKHPTVMVERREFDEMLMNVTHDNIKKIAVVHFNHLGEPFTNIKKVKKRFHRLFQKAGYFDRLVFLTEQQKQDVQKIYNNANNISVIPHSSEQINDIKNESDKNETYRPHLAITVARLHRDKQLDQAIRAFKDVVSAIPDAQYHIYGVGEEKENLMTLINELDLSKHVYLMGYTNNVRDAYHGAACSILTSRQEGFGMVITESMAVGTPVISYHTKYGPGDLIEDGINSFIVPMGDVQKMADRIIQIMHDTNLRKKMSDNALNTAGKYNEERFKREWEEVINEQANE
ncbi:glycosyltransferase [Virgibacillus halophilus]|uniref:Glycosyltransferase n=1 Tax=Tigheibacillus halophilus TaxID=361280 RepID=A0ABU5C479_9BACI|nr:glycosyltransferase [Virgibacillus halophilus]